MTTTTLEDRAAGWLDNTMNTLLTTHGLKKCVETFGSISGEMPREETKVRPDSFILDYISTLDIGDNLNRERGGKERSPPDNRVTKRRALVVYDDGNNSAWNTPLIDAAPDFTKNTKSTESIDLTKDESQTSASTDTI